MKDVPRRFDCRIAVGSPNGPRSYPWHIWRTKNDVYVAGLSGESSKLSFHEGGFCHNALTKERCAQLGIPDRGAIVWLRPATPERGKRGSCVAEIMVPTNYLSTITPPQEKRIT